MGVQEVTVLHQDLLSKATIFVAPVHRLTTGIPLELWVTESMVS